MKDENGNIKKEKVKKIIKVKDEKPKNENYKNLTKEEQKFLKNIQKRKNLNFQNLSSDEENVYNNNYNLSSQRRKKKVNFQNENEDY